MGKSNGAASVSDVHDYRRIRIVKRLHAITSALIVCLFSLSMPTSAASPPPSSLQCAAIARSAIPDTKIILAQHNTASPTTPAHCEVVGKINERVAVDGKRYAIGFHLRLPDDWNRRFYFQGGAGTDGNLGDALGGGAIMRGYAVVSTDAGHRRATPAPAASKRRLTSGV